MPTYKEREIDRYLYIYIYIEREREREGPHAKNKEAVLHEEGERQLSEKNPHFLHEVGK